MYVSVSSEVFKKWLRHIKLKLAFLFKTKFLKDYNTVIFSGDCISAVRNCRKDTKKIYYCHTPPRYLFDLRESYLKKVPLILRPIFDIISYIFKKMYKYDLSKIDLILTNSKNTQSRIQEFLWYNSTILYPPVDLEEFKYLWQEDYYLSFARLSDAKRVERIVKTFQSLPDKKLVIIYGENDPQKNMIFDMVKWYKNIEMVTLPWNIGFKEYVWKCIATLYIPIDEDFWMSPVESMSAGKPVIWVNDGWLKESIIDGETGILIDKEARVEDLIDAIRVITPEKALEMRENCENRAKDFSLENFEKQLKDYIQ